jgi:hypothetical protein
MIVVITKGSHARNTHIPPRDGEPRHYGHRWDPNDPEDVAHQAMNFTTYANALGGYEEPIVLLGPPPSDDEQENLHVKVNMGDWQDIVETATGKRVEIR